MAGATDGCGTVAVSVYGLISKLKRANRRVETLEAAVLAASHLVKDADDEDAREDCWEILDNAYHSNQ